MASLDPANIGNALSGITYAVTNLSSANALSGTIPEIFAALSSLRDFDVGEYDRNPSSLNNISGTLPGFEFANLSHGISFSTNPISGAMPDVLQQGSVAEF